MNPLEIPKLEKYVNDFSRVLPEAELARLDELFAERERKTGEQVVVILIPHREGHELLDIGLKVFNENGIGKKGLNNGLLLIIATEEKKIRIVTGKGMELRYTEMVCREIVENRLRPLLNKGSFGVMIERWSTSVADAKNIDELIEQDIRSENGKSGLYVDWLFIPFGVIIILFSLVFIDEVASGIIGLILVFFMFLIAWSTRQTMKKWNWRIFVLFSTILLGISLIGILVPANCQVTYPSSSYTSYSCTRMILGEEFSYTKEVRSGGSSSVRSSSYDGGGGSSSSDSDWGGSSSFGGGGGTSNGGGYGD